MLETYISTKWLKDRSQASIEVEKVIKNKKLVSDLEHFSKFKHTDYIEVYHALYTIFCPKRIHFSFHGMITRAQMAVMDFNGVSVQLQKWVTFNMLKSSQKCQNLGCKKY